MVLSSNTSNIGNPEISLTENKEPTKLSVIENNSPLSPTTVNKGSVSPEPITVNTFFPLADNVVWPNTSRLPALTVRLPPEITSTP